ncbi:pirin family protein [Paenibacillus sp. MBLB4367]|uniref:pirin family protein n=1 Tax=Paenibacillus sp. MBLB4367 TaxID=3384767 RepID=UPI003907F978
MGVTIYGTEQQGRGQFGQNGEISERKPIAFPREEGAVKRVGPLFYWAWAKANETFEIPPHPHSGFEIVSYVLKGTGVHSDSLGNSQQVSAGGAQVMQAGSGVHHAEKLEKDAELFQIWFEPNLVEANKLEPTYRQFEHEQFPARNEDGVKVKTIIGEGAPVSLITAPIMLDVTLDPGSMHRYEVPKGRAVALLVVEGEGGVQEQSGLRAEPLQYADFAVLTAANAESSFRFEASGSASLRFVSIEVPLEVNYFLYRK